MKTTRNYFLLLFSILLLGVSSSLHGESMDNYEIDNISDEFIEKFVVSPLTTNSTVLTGSGCSITITKAGSFNDANGDGFAQVGETITYTFTVCNDGSEDLFNVTVNDPLSPVAGSIAMLPAMTGSGMSMSGSGASCDATTFSTIYTLSASDIQNGSVSNTGVVNAFDGSGNPINNTSNTVVTTVIGDSGGGENPSILITKSSVLNDENGDGFAQVGETISYSFTVCNTGDVALNNVSIDDIIVSVPGTISLNSSTSGFNCNTTAFSATYTLTQQDLNNEEVINVASVTGTSLGGTEVMDQSNVDVTPLNVEPTDVTNASLEVIKNGFFNDENSDGIAQVGETITYTFRVCNDGDTDVFNITIDDPLVNVVGSIAGLPVATGSGVSCNYSLFAQYTINQNDIDNGQVINIADANGEDGEGNGVSDQSNASVVLLNGDGGIGDNSSISLSKSAEFNDENGDGFGQAGETITYSFIVCNTGDTQVNNISIFDPIAPVTANIASLNSIGQAGSCSITLTSTYTLGANDITAGQVINIATASGRAPNGVLVADTSDDPKNTNEFDANGDGEPDDPTITTFLTDVSETSAKISVQKTGTFNDSNNDGYAQAGETITYTFTVCNEGTEDVMNITLQDPLLNISGGPIDMLVGTGSGTACDMTSFTGVYTLLPSDIVNCQVTNIAVAQGFDSDGNLVSDISDDPFNPFNFDQNGDGNPDDPTVTKLNVEPSSLLGSLGNYVWEDLDGNGMQDINEPGIAGVRVELYNSNGILISVTYTDSAGFYLFENLMSGQYYVKFFAPNDYSFTTSNTGGNNLVDSNVGGSNGFGTTAIITLSQGENDLTIDAGLYRCIPLGELVWYDTNQNSVWDEVENGLNGIKVHVYRFEGGNYELYDVQFTGHKPGTPSDDGYWKICVPPGMYYVQYIIPPFGLVTALPDRGSNDLIDSDVTESNGPGTTATFTLTSGDTKCDLGAGYYPQATLGDRVWYDTNRNGQQEVNEPGAGGVAINVYDSQGRQISNIVTKADGTYTAEYLKDDEYYLEIQPPLGYVATTANATSDDLDSDVDHSHGANTTAAYRTLPGEHTPNVDAGLVSTFVLSTDWLAINADRAEGINTVYWSVASDTDVASYNVERKLGQLGDFESIGQATSAQSDEKKDYSLEDLKSTDDGQYFYRVMMTMFDGSENYSDIVYIEVTDQMDKENLASIYPNPAVNTVTLTVNVQTADSNVSISLINDLGQKVLTNYQLDSKAGIGTHKYSLDVSEYPRGRYIVEMRVGEKRTINKMVLVE